MIAHILTTATLLAGAALLCLPAHAQTGTSATTTINSGGASPTGSVGTTSRTPRNNSSATGTTMGPMGGGTTNSPGMSSQSGPMGAQGNMESGSGSMNQAGGMNYQAQAGSSHMRGDADERQMTECLNRAASQQQPLSACHR